ncbi:MAG: ABC transporter ATP-binding protein [Candidatus Tectomicrobia bacterium]|nr:ABC transporter ATP-binding protein [Candidatus Tectomicrobia bacterium]
MSTSDSQYELEVRNLSKVFGSRRDRTLEVHALKEINLRVKAGEFLTILGPSGGGKSTILNIIAQIETPTTGTIYFRGREVLRAGDVQMNPGVNCEIGYVTQEDNLLPWRTVIENIMFPIKVQNKPYDEYLERAHELMGMVNLTGFGNHYPYELSGGMRKRAVLIRTLLYDPPVILMDEPFGPLDAQTRTQLQEDLLRIWQAKRKTILFVTHDVAEAIVLADRTVVLTSQPGTVRAEYEIAIPRPRDVHDVYALPGFPEYYEKIRKELR